MILLNRALLWTTCAVFLIGTSNDILAQAAAPGGASSPNTSSQQSSPAPQAASSADSAASEPPDSPDTSRAKSQDSTQAAGSNQQESAGAAQNQKLQRPVGTAAAAAPKVNGVTAAKPAGVAIAPAKQHRVRTIVLRTGAILGAGAALGTVIALTAGTPSKPPGAH